MADEDLTQELGGGLEKAMLAMQEIQRRLDTDGELDEKELTMLSRMVASQIEEVRAKLEEAIGPMDADYLRKAMEQELSPTEYQEWLQREEDRREFRDEFAREAKLRAQLEDAPS
jgi:hypothetical protein